MCGPDLLIVPLVLTALVAAEKDEDASAFESLVGEWVDARLIHKGEMRSVRESEEFRRLESAGDWEGLRTLLETPTDPTVAFVPRFLELAERERGGPIEAECLQWLFMNGREPAVIATAVHGLAERHLDGDAFVAMMEHWVPFMRLERADTDVMLRRVIAESKRSDVVAQAHWLRSQVSRDPELREEVESLLRRDFPDSTPALRLDGEKFRRERLQIGMTAPEIEGRDVRGAAFKLSDYRGRVVMLDFWGDW